MAQSDRQEQSSTRERSAHEILQEERYLWMARAFVVMMVLAIICDIVLLIALANVTPVLRVQPFYLEIQSKEQQVVSIARPSFETLNSDTLKESLVRQYILARFGVGSDLGELEERWGDKGLIYWMSDQSVYDEFIKKESVPAQDRARRDNFIREVRILSVNKTRDGGVTGSDIWQVELEFRDIDRTKSGQSILSCVANMATAFRPSRSGLTWADRLKNPLGFVILDFGIQCNPQKKQK